MVVSRYDLISLVSLKHPSDWVTQVLHVYKGTERAIVRVNKTICVKSLAHFLFIDLDPELITVSSMEACMSLLL